jgi:hypothetical protein
LTGKARDVAACLTISTLLVSVAHADDTILARGWTHENYGRLVLDTGSDELSDIKAAGDVIVISFKRPVKVDMDSAINNLRPYLSAATPSADDRELTLRLKQAVSIRRFDDNGNLVIDLGAPTAAPAASVQTAAGTATTSPGKPIQPRVGDHSGFGRIAFDLPDNAGVAVRQDGNRVVIQFGKDGVLDLAKLQRDLPGRLQSVLAQNGPDGQRVTLSLKPGITLRPLQQGRVVVLDFYDAGKAPAGKPTALTIAATNGKSPTIGTVPATSVPSAAVPQPALATPVLQSLAPVAALPGQQIGPATVAPSTPAKPAKATPTDNLASLAATPVPSLPGTTSEPAAPPPSSVTVPVTVAPEAGGGAIVTFQWPKSTELAAFKRGDSLWLVFGAPADFSGDLIHAPALTQMGTVDRIDDKYASGLRISGANGPAPTIRVSGNTWIIELAPGKQGGVAKTIQQRRETLAQGGSSLLLEAANPGPVITLSDPTTGDRLQIAPLRDAGLGVAEQAVWPEFKLLPSYQGIVVAPLADNVSVEPLPNGVVVTTAPIAKPQIAATEPGATPPGAPPGQTSPDQTPSGETPAVPTAQSATPGAASATDETVAVAGLFDLPAWRRGGQATFVKDHDALEEAITRASPNERNAARLQLAEFLFANGLIPEAAGMLDIVASDHGSLPMENKTLLTLRAAADALKGDDADAAKLLADPQVGNSPEASLFRGVVAADKGDAATAAKSFIEPLPELKNYPKSLRVQLGLLIAKALIEGGNPMQAQAFTDAIRKDMPNAETTDRVAYLEGLRQMKMGQKDAAFETWAGLKDSVVEEVRAESQYAVVMEKLRSKQITPAEAIGPLEDLRFLARGGDFEFNLLRVLGESYLAAAQPRKGLLTLRQAVTNFPDRADTKAVAQEMSDAFQRLYLEGGADALSPLTAVALYDEFRELTPSGAPGDRMIAALADRLVKVDLLDGAAKLLDGQVKHRLSGIDKARAGARLAAVQLLNNSPDLAAQALNDSRVSDPLPEDLAALRRRLQSQADFGAGQTLKALDEINGDNSLPARWQRADMLWQLQEWPAAAAALGKVIDGEEQALAQQAAQIMARNNVAADPSAALRDIPLPGAAPAPAADAAAAPASPTPSDQAAAAPTGADILAAVRADAFKNRLGRVVLNRAVAMSLANDRVGLRQLARDYGKDMDRTALAKTFSMLTSPGNGLAESVTAEMASIDQINSFVDEYRNILRQSSLSSPALTN